MWVEREGVIERKREGKSQVIKLGNKPIDIAVGPRPSSAPEVNFKTRIHINIPTAMSDRYLWVQSVVFAKAFESPLSYQTEEMIVHIELE